MGSAGFGHWPDFFDRLMECRRRGAALRMIEAFGSAEPVLVTNRWAVIRDDPAWEPLREYLSERDWESFGCVPLIARGKPVGVLNAFFAPGQAMESAGRWSSSSRWPTRPRSRSTTPRCCATRATARDVRNGSGSRATCTIRSCSRSSRSVCRPSRLRCSPGAVRRCPRKRWRGSLARSAGYPQAALADLRAMVHELRPSALGRSRRPGAGALRCLPRAPRTGPA